MTTWTEPKAWCGRRRCVRFPQPSLRPRFVNDVEWGFASAAETGEAGLGDHVANPRSACLRAEAPRYFLRARTRRAEQRGERVIHAARRGQIFLHGVVGKRLDNHPSAIFAQRLADVFGGADGIAHIM